MRKNEKRAAFHSLKRTDSAAIRRFDCQDLTIFVSKCRFARVRCARSLDVELLDAVAKLAERQPKQLRGRRLVVARLLQRVDDGLALDVLELGRQRAGFDGAINKPATLEEIKAAASRAMDTQTQRIS